MYDSLLVYENFPPGELVGGGEFTANGATFRPASLESLSHFPVTIAAHMVDDQLTVLVEVVDGALGSMSPESLGGRLLSTVQRLIAQWDSPLRDVSVLLDGEVPTSTGPDSRADRHRCAHQVHRDRVQQARVARAELV